MPLVKVQLADNIKRVIRIDSEATKGATIGTNLYLADGSLATGATLAALIGAGASSVPAHRLLPGLTLGDDHPQYTQWVQNETITGQWQWTKPLWGPNGSNLLPAFTFTSDPNTGVYNVGADDLGIATNGVLRLDVSTTAVTSTLPWLGPIGLVGSPGVSFSGDTNTGLYNVGADQLGITTGGVLRLTTSTTAFTGTLPWQGQDGSVGTPALSFSGDTNTGIYRIGTDNFGFTTGGVLRWDIDTNDIVFTLPEHGPVGSDAVPTYSFSAHTGTGMSWQDASGSGGTADEISFTAGGTHVADIGTLGIDGVAHRSDSGSATAPSFTFWASADINTGMYRVGEDQIGFTTGGTLRVTVNGSTSLISTLPWRGPAGSAGTPSVSFSTDPDTGIYTDVANLLRFTTGGTERFNVGSTGLDSGVPIRATDGSAGTPSFSFWNDTSADTGFYRVGENQIGVTTGGTLRLTINGSTSFIATLPWRGQDGTAAAPAFSFSSDSDNGMYLTATANTLGFSTAGVVKFQIGASGQWGIGGATYGTAGQTLLSGGALAAPTWGNPTLVSANFANPAASVGLTTVNGSAVTAMRSDAAPALDQSIVPTWTGQHTFTRNSTSTNGDGAVAVAAAVPVVSWRATGAAADNRTWVNYISGTSFIGASIDDANSVIRNWLAVARSGTAIASITFGNATNNPTFAFAGTGQTTFADGSVGTPGVSFANDPDTGIYRLGGNNIAIACGGVQAFDVTTARTRIAANGTDPTLSVFNAGVREWTVSVVTATGSFSAIDASAGITALTLLGNNGQAQFVNGSVTAPAISFITDPNTGVYRIGADNIGVAAGGVKVLDVNGTVGSSPLAFTWSGDHIWQDNKKAFFGTSSIFSAYYDGTNGIVNMSSGELRFTSSVVPMRTRFLSGTSANNNVIVDTTTSTNDAIVQFALAGTIKGQFGTPGTASSIINGSAAGEFCFRTNGTDIIWSLDSGSSIAARMTSGAFRGPDGTVALPALSFLNDTDCGVYRIGTNNIGVAAGGAKVLDIATTGLAIVGALTHSDTKILKTTAGFTNGAAAQAGTLLNAPTAGNPTKWIPIDDNGTTRYIPAW